MNFSVNQARHLYVAKTVSSAAVTSESAAGSIKVSEVNSKDGTFYFQYKGADNLMRSDIISKDNIICAKAIAADDASQKTYLKKAVISLAEAAMENSKPIPGEDYILRIVIRQFAGMSDEDTYIKHGVVHAYKGMTAAQFYTALAKSLNDNFSRELTKMFTFTAAASGVTIQEVELTDWVLGVRPQTTVNFEVYAAPIEVDGEEIYWAQTGNDGKIAITNSTTALGNGKKIADLEYFCMGERGDIYRNVGWPNVIPTTYMVDPSKTYNILEIHYAYVGSNEGPQRSEKDIEIVCDSKAELDKLITQFNTASGLSVKTLSTE